MTGRASEVPGRCEPHTHAHRKRGERRHTQKVDILVDGIALDGREAKCLHELFPEILNADLGSTNLQGLLLCSLEVLLLADIGHCSSQSANAPSVRTSRGLTEADDFISLLQEPCYISGSVTVGPTQAKRRTKDTAGVETATAVGFESDMRFHEAPCIKRRGSSLQIWGDRVGDSRVRKTDLVAG